MPRPASPENPVLAGLSLLFGAFLVVWWFALLPPLLGWTRISTDILLGNPRRFPRLPPIPVCWFSPGEVWALQAPIRINGQTRNVRVETAQRLPTQLTMAIPLFWAIVLAARRTRRTWRTLAVGSAVLFLLPPLGLLIYAARIVQIYVYPNASALLVRSMAGRGLRRQHRGPVRWSGVTRLGPRRGAPRRHYMGNHLSRLRKLDSSV